MNSTTDELFIDLDPGRSPPTHHVYLSPVEAAGGLDCIEAVATSLEDFSLVSSNNNNNNNSNSSNSGLSPCQKGQRRLLC